MKETEFSPKIGAYTLMSLGGAVDSCKQMNQQDLKKSLKPTQTA